MEINQEIRITENGMWQDTKTTIEDIDGKWILVGIRSTIDYCTHWFWLTEDQFEIVDNDKDFVYTTETDFGG